MNYSAFPVMPPTGQDVVGQASGYPYPETGMTLRDYFAAKAMNGLVSADWVTKKS